MEESGSRSDQSDQFFRSFDLVLVRLFVKYIRYIILTSTVFDSAKIKIKL